MGEVSAAEVTGWNRASRVDLNQKIRSSDQPASYYEERLLRRKAATSLVTAFRTFSAEIGSSKPWNRKKLFAPSKTLTVAATYSCRCRRFPRETDRDSTCYSIGAHSISSPAISLDFTTLLAQHDRWLRTVIFARVREGQAVDEVLQEVSLAAIKQQAPILDPSRAAPWLYRLAVLQSLLYRRRCGRRRKLVERAAQLRAAPDIANSAHDPLRWMVADERRQLVRVAMSQLASRDAELLLLKYTEHWSYTQMADHLGISTSAVEARLHRARARLRTLLESLELQEGLS